MKIASIAGILAAIAFAPAAGFAASHDHGAMPAKAGAEAPLVEGQVKKVDKTAGKVTLSHGPLVNLGMPAMTMAFRVKDSAWLDQMKDGDKIRFLADRVNGAFTVVQFEAAK